MQKFELSEEMLENVTEGMSDSTLKKISTAAGAVVAASVMAVIGTVIYISKKKKKQEHTLEIGETGPRKRYAIEYFYHNQKSGYLTNNL